MTIARVAIDRATVQFDKEYDYIVPAHLGQKLKAGCRVVIPFGSGNRNRMALVLDLLEGEHTSKLKEIFGLVDEEPLLGPEELGLLRYLREQTFCLYFDALRAIVPPGIGVNLVGGLTAKRGILLPDSLPSEAVQIYEYLLVKKKPVDEKKLLADLGLKENHPALARLIEAGAIERGERLRQRIQDERIAMVRMAELSTSKKLTDRQRAVIELLLQVGCASIKEVIYFCGVTRAVVDRLITTGVLESFEESSYRSPNAGRVRAPSESPILTPDQEAAFQSLKDIAQSGKPSTSLLYGVTGSGKTQVFIRLIEDALARGLGSIVLVPEIALTPQTVQMFYDRFGERVAVLHSSLSMAQRMDEWKRIKEGLADIVVGTRSAVFAPVKKLGIIVIDEEQEHTYHSESAPRFHARQVAALRSRWHNAAVILSSATPSVESYSNALAGKYNLVTLSQRYQGYSLPEVTVIDMRDSLLAGGSTAISEQLSDELMINLKNGQQSILLLNRRGYNTLIKCSSCGEVTRCPHCSIPMTYHAANGRLVCHYCGHSQPPGESCPSCKSKLIRYSGVGTQRVEEELHELFPDARILRMDMDTTMSRFSHEKAFDAFSRGEYDIMIGTQMVAKGLNFPSVTLVGVLMADQALYADDFRSYERTFSLITQVVGRGGRGVLPGRAFIQTYTPDNRVISLASAQDYPGFYAEEIEFRRLGLYPPYCDMCCIGFSGEDRGQAERAAKDFLVSLKARGTADYSDLPLRALGPSEASPFKAAGRYRYKLILKCRNTARMRQLLHQLLTDHYGDKQNRELTVYIDMHYDGNI